MTDSFEKHARTVTLLTFISRVTGLVRDAALARVFGLSPLADAFWFAFAIPNLFRRLFGEGALSAAFLPVYTQLDRDNPAVARQLATLTISLLLVLLGGLTLVGEVALAVIHASATDGNLSVQLMMIMLPYMPMVCLVAILGAMLQVHGRFGPTAAAPIVLNLVLVAAAVGLGSVASKLTVAPIESTSARTAHITLVSCSVLIAGVAQVIWSLWSMQRMGRASGVAGTAAGAAPGGGGGWWVGGPRKCGQAVAPMRGVLRQALPMFIGLGVLQINTFMDDLIASYPTTVGPTIFGVEYPLAKGSLAAINNAQRLYEFPLGVFGIAVATAIFPALARVANDSVAFGDILRRGLRLVVYIGLPASAGLILVREQLTAAIFQGGDFTPDDTKRVAFVLMGFAPAIWAYSMTHTLTRAFYARGDSMTPVKVAVGMVLLNFALNAGLIWTPLKEAGLAWSTATCAIVQVFILLRLTRRYASHVVDRSVVMSWLRTAAVTLIMAAAVWGASVIVPTQPTWRSAVIELGVLVIVGAATVLAASRLMRMPELGWALGRSHANPVNRG